jgi:hypothetical protein
MRVFGRGYFGDQLRGKTLKNPQKSVWHFPSLPGPVLAGEAGFEAAGATGVEQAGGLRSQGGATGASVGGRRTGAEGNFFWLD